MLPLFNFRRLLCLFHMVAKFHDFHQYNFLYLCSEMANRVEDRVSITHDHNLETRREISNLSEKERFMFQELIFYRVQFSRDQTITYVMNLISCLPPIKTSFVGHSYSLSIADQIRYNGQIKYNQRDFLDSYPMMMLSIKR